MNQFNDVNSRCIFTAIAVIYFNMRGVISPRSHHVAWLSASFALSEWKFSGHRRQQTDANSSVRFTRSLSRGYLVGSDTGFDFCQGIGPFELEP
jgi:hypothetical protein